MSVAEPPRAGTKLTVEEFLALPDDGVERALIRGVLREYGPVPYRNRFHSRVEVVIATELELWSRSRPEPRGQVVAGDAGFRLRGTADSLVGIDVAYVGPEQLAATPRDARIFDGPPVLAVEILSPSDTQEGIAEKIELYLQAGAVAWKVDSRFGRITVHRPGHEPVMFNAAQELAGDPYLPDFRVPVARIFVG